MTMDNKRDNHDARQWEEAFRTEMRKLDDEALFPVPVPDLASLERMIVAEKRQLRRKLMRDLLLFWLFGVMILGLLVAVLYKSPLLIAWLQAPILLGAYFIGSRASKKRAREERT